MALKWETYIILQRLVHHRYVSLPGEFISLDTQFKYSNIIYRKSPQQIALTWTFDKYNQYNHFFYQNATECSENIKPKDSYICLKFSSKNKNKNYIIFNFVSVNELRMISWNEASESCKEMDGYLPYFIHKQHLDELIAFVKLSKDIPPTQALFIGLAFIKNKVSFSVSQSI